MSEYRATAVTGALFVVVLGAGLWLSQEPPPPPDPQPALVRFEKDELVGFRIERPEVTLEAKLSDSGQWEMVGRDWRPRRSMIRRVAHQLHDLDARAIVATAPESYEPYGLGESAIHVALTLRDGSTVRFDAGDPNPTSVSHYVRPLPGDTVYVVKKAAMDYYGWTLDSFREDRFAWLRAEDATRIDATVDGRRLLLERTGPRSWAMLEPVVQEVEREQARTMLGRTASLRALEIVDVSAEERSERGLAAPQARVQVDLADGQQVVVWVGSSVPDTDPPQAWMSGGPSGAVYLARLGFLDAFQLPLEAYRRMTLLPELSAAQLQSMEVRSGELAATLLSSPDGWRWEDGSAAAGSTPGRLAELACGIRALEFFDDEVPADAGLEQPSSVLTLVDRSGERTTLVLGAATDGGAERYLRVEGQPAVVLVDNTLAQAVSDLKREAERHALDAAERAPVAPPK